MTKNLIIVESPNKVEKIQSFFNKNNYKVIASVGHIRDLKKFGTQLRLGINLENMEPIYENIKEKKEVIKKINEEAKNATNIYIATDPDREGEAIGWHIAQVITNKEANLKRIYFNEITKEAVLNSLKNVVDLNMNLVNSQETRRMLDRIIGFRLSFLTNKKLAAPSAGRVKSSTLKLIIDRENEIKNFKPDYWWTIDAELEKEKVLYNSTRDFKIINYKTLEEAESIFNLLGENFTLIDKNEKFTKITSPVPLEMATFLMGMYNNYGMSNTQATFTAQSLYEKGLITYPRTDSVRISSKTFLEEAKSKIINTFGEEYYQGLNLTKIKKSNNIQDAHEAIRPTNINKGYKDIANLNSHEKKAYDFIWKSTMKALMTSGENKLINLLYSNNENYFIYKITTRIFLGFRIIDEGAQKIDLEKEEQNLLNEKIKIKKEKIKVIDHQTSPPPRYNQATIIKKLKSEGIGRPSTYATTTSGLINYNYLTKENNYLTSTELAQKVNDLLIKEFNDIVNEKYTAKMEEELDSISDGNVNGREFLKEFWNMFEPRIKEADKNVEQPKVEYVNKKCPDCGNELVYKNSRFGKFIGCSNYPTCKHIEKIVDENKKQSSENKTTILLEEKCPVSDHNLVIRKTRYNTYFVGCSSFPKCKYIMEKEKAKILIEKYMPKNVN